MRKNISILLAALLLIALGVWIFNAYQHTRETKKNIQTPIAQAQPVPVPVPTPSEPATPPKPQLPPKKPLLAESVLDVEHIPSIQTMKTNGAKYAAEALERRAIRQAELKKSLADKPMISKAVSPKVKLNLGYRQKDMNKDFYEFGHGQIAREGYAGFGISF